ncbi:UDP-N-acetylmuramyl pentapeptide phosphotransferase/UDP-N-acetylglucosamine-1-phosphate transferase [Leucobacter luti]|uniref:UDP-N-acetylmuramyl pentapeptide phosphotransferase/UDP-N-acetylglucosamine-1-phosphate transferase n=1 Tax=Leucobacter luti TaxID=340320 RepID=A0A4R6SA87_9MICO|nr:UDP-phosphate alpha-N-acetyl-D-fucosaminephosphotransferase [Leucobacter luti]TDP95765.1 UDP-N-acetylmuramyl pentapeptide phosphotransferase/UDP-N-acetylglucosamine-1-phosphate transferase [Leucobacter luti]
MTPLAVALCAGVTTLLLSLVLPVVVKPLLVRLGIMDVPNERSSHERPVLRGLGLAVLIAMLVGGAVAVLLFAAPEWGGSASWSALLVIVLGSLFAGLLGLTEDLRGLSVGLRSTALLLIAAGSALGVLVVSGAVTGEVRNGPGLFGDELILMRIANDGTMIPVEMTHEAALPLWGIVLLAIYAVLFISSYINVANFMDGLNGISGFHGAIAGFTFAAVGASMNQPWLLAAGLVLGAGFLGFLPWNLSKPGAFLGDVGSYLLGGATAITSFAALIAGAPLLATIGPMVIYFGDVGVTLVKRVRAGHKWDEPHKEHTYQRIQQLGYTHVQASGITAACTLAASLLGLASLFTGLWGTLALLAGGLAVLVLYLALPRLLPARVTRPHP